MLTSPNSVLVRGNLLTLLRDGREMYPAMLAAIARAEVEILLEMYWFATDHVGTAFLDALVRRARAGVSVRVIYDSVGSLRTPHAFFRPLIDAGGRVHEFSPVFPFRKAFRMRRISFRDHRKILVIDSRIAFTGGLNLGEEWQTEDAGGRDWRDDGVQVEGPVAVEFRALFFQTWQRFTGEKIQAAERFPRTRVGEIGVLANQFRVARHRRIGANYLSAIQSASRSIDITNPYFLPGPRFLLALRKARARGVDIRLLVPARSDVWLLALASSVLYAQLLEHRIRIFQYVGRTLHAKTATFDQRLVMIGTSNLDMRSWRYNRECNLLVQSVELGALQARSFEEDLTHALELTAAIWVKRPRIVRALAWIAYLFRQFL